jgi:hypothetical protein
VDLDARGRRLRAALAAVLVRDNAPELRLVTSGLAWGDVVRAGRCRWCRSGDRVGPDARPHPLRSSTPAAWDQTLHRCHAFGVGFASCASFAGGVDSGWVTALSRRRWPSHWRSTGVVVVVDKHLTFRKCGRRCRWRPACHAPNHYLMDSCQLGGVAATLVGVALLWRGRQMRALK